uniref:Uncharacterized protein n=1 Tax=Trachysalambria curvirostris nimavirus TaxID=2984282 RepID=A0A9C7BMZ6_9VIRU|nr:MAG: hypothetical protein [Trachysalambria curvirostris nimavirus]
MIDYSRIIVVSTSKVINDYWKEEMGKTLTPARCEQEEVVTQAFCGSPMTILDAVGTYPVQRQTPEERDSKKSGTEMVAPYEVGDPVILYVCVPGSGSDKTARSLCCDLSRVSSAAASVPVRPAAATVLGAPIPSRSTRQQISNGRNANSRQEEKEQVKVDKKEKPVQPQQSATQQTVARSRKRATSDDSATNNAAKRVYISRVAKLKKQVSLQLSGASQGRKEADDKIICLEKQLNELKQQNLQLQQRLRATNLVHIVASHIGVNNKSRQQETWRINLRYFFMQILSKAPQLYITRQLMLSNV